MVFLLSKSPQQDIFDRYSVPSVTHILHPIVSLLDLGHISRLRSSLPLKEALDTWLALVVLSLRLGLGPRLALSLGRPLRLILVTGPRVGR